VQVTGIVKLASLQQAIEESVKPAFIDLNLRAMKLGIDLAKNYEK
jgi:Pyruvate/2-oxoacid:ferredoxin oxidoreductase gamma subunit